MLKIEHLTKIYGDKKAVDDLSLHPAKQHRLICAAQKYLQQTGQSEEPVRFDVAEVVPLDSGRWMVHIIKGAFLCEP